MEPRSARKLKGRKGRSESHLSPVLLENGRGDRSPSAILDALTNFFLFVLGGVILCAMLYAVVSFT